MTDGSSNQEYLDTLRGDCLSSLYLFAVVCCGFDRMTPSLHKDMCDFLQHDRAIRKLLMAPRDHYKSSVVQAFILWRLAKNSEERVLVVGDTAQVAEGKLKKIKDLLLTRKMLRLLFPRLIPQDVSKNWSADAIILSRDGAYTEASISARGTSAARAGEHFTLIVCDDIATKQAKDEPTTMRKIIEWSDGAESMLELPYQHEIIVVGTPWAYDDVYEHVERMWSSEPRLFKSFKQGFFGSIGVSDGEPIFPELYGGLDNAKAFIKRQLETNYYLASANYLLSPQVEGSEFNPEHLQYYELDPTRDYILYASEDVTRPHVLSLNELSIYMTIDPAFSKDPTASKAAVAVSGVDNRGNVFVLESIGERPGTEGLVRKIVNLCGIYKPYLRRVGVEKAGQQESFKILLQRELRESGFYLMPDLLPPGSKKSKEIRIREALQPYVSQRRLYIRPNMVGLIDEMNKFPLSKHKDELDALSMAADHYWKLSTVSSALAAERWQETFEVARQSASPITGY